MHKSACQSARVATARPSLALAGPRNNPGVNRGPRAHRGNVLGAFETFEFISPHLLLLLLSSLFARARARAPRNYPGDRARDSYTLRSEIRLVPGDARPTFTHVQEIVDRPIPPRLDFRSPETVAPRLIPVNRDLASSLPAGTYPESSWRALSWSPSRADERRNDWRRRRRRWRAPKETRAERNRLIILSQELPRCIPLRLPGSKGSPSAPFFLTAALSSSLSLSGRHSLCRTRSGLSSDT